MIQIHVSMQTSLPYYKNSESADMNLYSDPESESSRAKDIFMLNGVKWVKWGQASLFY